VHIRFSSNPNNSSAANFSINLDDNPRLGAAMSAWFFNLGKGVNINQLEHILSN
jgi:hypothetical protein